MAFLACIVATVSWICQPVMTAVQSSLETGAQGCFPFLTNLVVGQVNTPVSSCSGDFQDVPVSPIAIVGAEETLAEIRAHLNDDSVRIIGIYGMGGAGKTTLLRKIINELHESMTARGKFDRGIWLTVSKEVSIPEIQKEIARRLRLTLTNDEFQDARTLSQALSQRRFLVLLDDLWEELDLVRVGIPTNRRNCKLAFTTRFRHLYTDMDANRFVEVKPLADDPSWELFHSKVGTEVDLNNPPIRELAKQVVGKCGGLPLALITVGRAMANRRHPGEWELAVKALDHKAEELGDMKDQVLSQLKFCYDYLKNDKMRSALLYCAMYPEDTEIERDELIEHWIGEGMLDDDDDVDDRIDGARNRGHVLITDLQHSCLLEASIRDAVGCVRMHDAVRDLALWLNRTACDKDDEFRAGWITIVHPDRPENVRRICMPNLCFTAAAASFIEDWPPNSWTLLLNDSRLEPSPLQGIFNCMRTLRVLVLTSADLPEELPIEIGFLQALQYLNLSLSTIRSLPKELGNLVRLRLLDLRSTRNLCSIPREAIVGLSSLQVLDMRWSAYEWRAQGEMPTMEVRMVDDEENKQHSSSDTGATVEGSGSRQVEVSDLESLDRLQELLICLKSPHALEQLSRPESLRRCMRYLVVHKTWEDQGEDGPLRMTFTKMFGYLRQLQLFGDWAVHRWVGNLRISLDLLPCLEYLSLYNFHCRTTTATTVTIVLEGTNAESFRRLDVIASNGWKEVKLLGKFPSLEAIGLINCDGVEELLWDDDNDGTGSQQDTTQEQLLDSHFPMLKTIYLIRLRDLKSIGRRPLFLPSLEVIYVDACPLLRRLPLGPESAPKLKKIRGKQGWWDALEWGSSGDDLNIQNIFAPFLSTSWP